MRWEDLLAMKRVVDEENDWHHCPENVYRTDGLSLVSKISTSGKRLKAAVKEAADLIGGVRKSLSPNDRVLLKCNFNSPDPLPAATDSEFLRAVVELLREEGINKLAVGERSGWPSMPTKNVLEKLRIYDLGREMDFPVIDFDNDPWMDVRLGKQARWWEKVAYPKALKEFDKIVYLPCLKTHFLAGYTASLKLAVGLTHPTEMAYMHADFRGDKPHEPMWMKMIEFNIPVRPDLIIVDGRKAFVTEGPIKGEAVEPGVIMASGDQIAIDVEGVKILQSYPRANLIQGPVWKLPMITRAIELGLGAGSETDYRVVTD
jgi:uncharacterized protein (DUF362 family)